MCRLVGQHAKTVCQTQCQPLFPVSKRHHEADATPTPLENLRQNSSFCSHSRLHRHRSRHFQRQQKILDTSLLNSDLQLRSQTHLQARSQTRRLTRALTPLSTSMATSRIPAQRPPRSRSRQDLSPVGTTPYPHISSAIINTWTGHNSTQTPSTASIAPTSYAIVDGDEAFHAPVTSSIEEHVTTRRLV